jgi:phosphoglycerol transferase MdoB-like AlkP superfamily enzyme
MEEYLARENLETQGYTGASGWGYHNDVMYKETLQLLDEYRNDKLLLVTKTLDMHQPYPYYGISYENMPPDVRDQGTITVCGMYWVDKTLENFFKEAKNRGLMDERTLFVITSDHNPHSGGEYKTLVTKEIDKRSVAPIPLIFVSSNVLPLAALATEEYASQEDLAPTLLPLMGAVTPPDFMGRDLRLPAARSYALGYFGGKAYYYSEEEDIVAELNEALPDTPEKDALANYLMYHYTKRHRENS